MHITASDQTRIPPFAHAWQRNKPLQSDAKKRARGKIHITAPDQRRDSLCGNPFAKQLVTSIAKLYFFKATYTSHRVTHDVREICCLRKSLDVCVFLSLRVRHHAWVNRDVRCVSACQARCACVSLSASESPCASVSACHSRCACFSCLLVSLAVCVECWLRARHHVRVLCLGFHHDVNVFGGNGQEISASVLVILRARFCHLHELADHVFV